MKKLIVVLIVFLMLVFCNATMSQAVTLSFDPISQDVLLGNPVDVELTISGLGNYSPDSLSTFDLNIGFDPAILDFSSVSYGDPVLGDQLDLLGVGFPIITTTPSVGSVNLFELSFNTVDELNNSQADSFTLTTLTFDTLFLGTSSLDISVNTLGDANGNQLTYSLESGSINVIPEPATILLLSSGLAGLGFLRKKKKNQVN